MILIVDDNEDSRKYLAALLRRQGFTVRTADGAGAALAMMRQQMPRLVVLDEQMPGMTGLELLEQLRADREFEDVRVVFLSAAFEHGKAKRALDLGALEWLVKGVHGPKHILAAVARAYAPAA
jgi:CheY-like chemotaxis protein